MAKYVVDNFKGNNLCLKHVQNSYIQQQWNGERVKALRILHCPRKGKKYQLDVDKSKVHAVIPKAAIPKVWFTDNCGLPKALSGGLLSQNHFYYNTKMLFLF